MKKEDIFEALGEADEKFINEALEKSSAKRFNFKPLIAVAACLCIIAAVGVLIKNSVNKPQTTVPAGDAVKTEEGVFIPKMTVEVPQGGVMADMIGFFIYGGRSYVQFDFVKGTNLVGDYVATATGSIDEWTSRDGYVELSGSVGGEFYTVKGYDPSFMLCMVWEDSTELFVNNNDIVIKNGADIYENRLHINGRIKTVKWQTHKDWNEDLGNVKTLDGKDLAAAQTFMDALCCGEALSCQSVGFYTGGGQFYHLFLELDDGVTVHLRLAEGGYVAGVFQDVCIKVDDSAFTQMLGLLK